MADDDDDHDQQEKVSRYVVRQVTDFQVSWTQDEPGEEGVFTLQLILDRGVEEHILTIDSDDLDVMLELFEDSTHVMFDRERKVLMFENFKVK